MDSKKLATRKLDARALKAFAHPVRLRLYELLEQYGAATATQLAARVDESSGVTSYHLRQLAKHGIIEDVPERGRGKERWWRAAGFSADLDEARRDPATAGAAEVMITKMVQQRYDEMAAWVAQRDLPREWIEASMTSRWSMRLTREELGELNEQVMTVVNAFSDRFRSRHTAEEQEPGTTRVVVYFDSLPMDVTP
ncbi:winged helix-turn-helix domain-containing protein [Nonomuraea sp. NPDC050556]|uniref:winged helix-turn-helix domain-containing protein n=1 Tax=Nonomuraea sp. NPDC050556 TaxID=3364369 RepID=UPI00379BC9BB